MSIWTETTSDALERQYQALLVVVEYFSGLAVWDLVQSLSFDFALLRRKRGNGLALFIVYGCCRYISLVSVLCRAVYICALAFHDYKVLRYTYEITYYISMAFACHILALHGATVCRATLATCALALAQLGLYISMFLGVFNIRSDSQQDIYRPVFCVYFASSSSFITVVVLASLLARLYRSPPIFSECDSDLDYPSTFRFFSQYNQDHVVDLLVVSTIWTVATVLCYLALDPTTNLRRLIEYVAYVVTIVCACKIFRTLCRQKNVHPMLLHYVVLRLQRRMPQPALSPPMSPALAYETPPCSRFTPVLRASQDEVIELNVLPHPPVLSVKTDFGASLQSGPSSSRSALAWTQSPQSAIV